MKTLIQVVSRATSDINDWGVNIDKVAIFEIPRPDAYPREIWFAEDGILDSFVA